jgi:formamidopyrimidine-DNA glycosylase
MRYDRIRPREVLMPELPDINAYLHALEARILGCAVAQVRIASPFVLRTAEPPVAALEGLRVRALERIGKRVAIGLELELWIVIHLMIAGRLHWRPPGVKLAGRNQLAAVDFATGSLVLTEAGTKRRASVHVVSGRDALVAMNPGGIEVLSSSFTEFRAALAAENRTLKRALTDPRVVSGIGNAYSDEILHAAQLSPLAQTGKLLPDEWARLYEAARTTLAEWMTRLRAEAARNFPEKVTAFRPEMAVHGRFGHACPRCGETVMRIRYADKETNYCPRCQTGGRLLADRALSRLLGADWPRSLEDLENLKRD